MTSFPRWVPIDLPAVLDAATDSGVLPAPLPIASICSSSSLFDGFGGRVVRRGDCG